MEAEQAKLPLPELNPEEYKFVDAYLECRDVGKAAIAAGLPARMGPPLYRRENVHAVIAERMSNIEQEHDKLVATRRLVHIEMLDKNLAQVITLPRKALLENPSLATPKVNAIELGYRRVGMLIDDNFIPDGSSGPAQVEMARIYRPSEQTTIITHQITETRQIVTKKTAEPNPEPPVIDAGDPMWGDF